MIKILLKGACFLFILLFILSPLNAQQKTPVNYRPLVIDLPENFELYPNSAGLGMMTPTGWGGVSPMVFGFIGGTFPQVYSKLNDMIGGAGIGVGNSYKNINVVGVVNIHDASEFNTLSGSIIASRHIGIGTSLSGGALNIFRDTRTDAGSSFYLALSHASQRIKSKTEGYSGLSYTIGVGSGRFYDKSPKDISTGKSKHGTAAFANLSYELARNLNVIAEWSGINLGMALGWRPFFSKNSGSVGGPALSGPALTLGVADLTRSSGDKPRLILSLSQSFSLSKKGKSDVQKNKKENTKDLSKKIEKINKKVEKAKTTDEADDAVVLAELAYQEAQQLLADKGGDYTRAAKQVLDAARAKARALKAAEAKVKTAEDAVSAAKLRVEAAKKLEKEAKDTYKEIVTKFGANSPQAKVAVTAVSKAETAKKLAEDAYLEAEKALNAAKEALKNPKFF